MYLAFSAVISKPFSSIRPGIGLAGFSKPPGVGIRENLHLGADVPGKPVSTVPADQEISQRSSGNERSEKQPERQDESFGDAYLDPMLDLSIIGLEYTFSLVGSERGMSWNVRRSS